MLELLYILIFVDALLNQSEVSKIDGSNFSKV